MRMYDIIHKKRLDQPLTSEELEFLVNGYVRGDIPDYQVSAFLMAVCFNGMTDEETAMLTSFMANSGDMLDLSAFGATSVDKHSTGGVGDKTTLIVAPIVASLGCTVAKLSGRGLGHTGGTIDKLESIKGFRTDLSDAEFKSAAKKCGVCVCGAGNNLAPADKKLYALRDVTATVSSIPLIVSSIMSKKLAGGVRSIVLDVKCGSGSFMKTLPDARELAGRMVSIGKFSGRNVSAVITNMDQPLGKTVGNSLEVLEAAAFLRNDDPDPRLLEVCFCLSAEIVSISKKISYEDGYQAVRESFLSGKAYETFLKWIALQGGDISVFDSGSDYGKARYITEVLSPCDGYISAVNAEEMGVSAMLLGAGRAKKTDIIDANAGITLLASVGDRVSKGEPLARFQSDAVSDHTQAHSRWLSSITFSETPPAPQTIVYEFVR